MYVPCFHHYLPINVALCGALAAYLCADFWSLCCPQALAEYGTLQDTSSQETIRSKMWSQFSSFSDLASGDSHGKGEGHVVHAGVNCVRNVCGSAHSCGCVVKWQFC